MKQKTITILWGLPGSGKTTYAESQSNTYVIDCDSLAENSKNSFDLLNKLSDKVVNAHYNQNIIIDGLITKNKQAKDIMEAIEAKNTYFNFIWNIVYWAEDRVSCLENDRGRRKISSANSINTIEFEKPKADILGIKQERISKRKIVRISLDKIWANNSNVFTEEELSNGKVVSDYWCTGGVTGGSCWDEGPEDPHYARKADTPLEFDRFDEILEKLIPDIGFFKYRKIKAKCVELKERHENDYYGNYSDYANWECDIKKLYDELVSMELIKPVKYNDDMSEAAPANGRN